MTTPSFENISGNLICCTISRRYNHLYLVGLRLPGRLSIARTAACIIINIYVRQSEAASEADGGPAEFCSGSTHISEGQTVILL
jgi:hypothetical protein